MYLDNLEQSKVPGEVEPTEAMLAEQCHVPKLPEAADFSNILKGNAVLLEYTDKTVVSREVDPSILCVEHCDMKRDESEPHTYCKGHSESFEQYSASEGFFETDQTVDQCETSGLSQPFDECAQHCECFKTCKSSESCANHSLASKCSPCCEHCTEHLQLFQQCEPSDQQFESFDFEPNTLAVKGDSFEHCEMSDSIPEGMDHLDLLQHYEPCDQQCESFDSEPDTSIEDSEQCEMTGFITDISDSVDLLDCGTELCEYGEFQNQKECNNDDEDADYDDEYNYPPEQEEEQIDMEPINEESCTLSEDSSHPDTPVHIYLDDREDEPSESESHQLTEENSQQTTTLDVSTDHLGISETDFSESCQDYEPTQQCATSEQWYSEETSELCTEEDDSSDCSSIETKSFETCPDESIPPNPCSDLYGESEKEAQEDSSDEQTQWDSFEDEEEIEQSNIDARIEDTMETPTLDVAVEDYFDLFDRSDYYGHVLTQTQLYISCFDGGDIHDHFYFEKVQKEARELAKNANKCEELNKGVHVQGTDTCLDAPEDASEDTYEEDENPRDDTSCGSCESEEQPEAWIEESESSLAEDEVEVNELEAHAPYEENCEEAEGEEDTFDGEACTFGSHESEICNEEEYEVCPSSGNEESAYAPCADNISVEGDAYEYEQSVAQNSESLATSTFGPLETHVTDCVRDDKDEPEPKDNECIACAELEPYWSLVDPQENGEMCEQGVEEYYAYQIKSIQSSVNQALNDFLVGGTSQNQIINGKATVNASSDEQEEALLSLKDTDLEAHEEVLNEIQGVGFAITEVIDLSLANGHFPESDDDSGFSETSSKINALDIIHSVVQTSVGRDANSTSDQSRDSEEEPSDDEYEDADCDCDHCIPPIEQVPAKPLLPRIKSNDAGKICVVIDLDETLVHSSFKPVNNADFIIPVEIDGTVHQVYVLKRPHVDEFLKRMGELFECVLFTASLAKYADPVSDLLDKWGAFRYRLFRESCVFHKGNYVKDLGRLGRDLNKVIIIDNSPASYVFHPDNAVPVVSWFDDMSDTELLDLIPFFERLSKVDDVYDTLQQQMTSS